MLTSIIPFINAMLPALTMATMGQAYYHGSGSIPRYQANQPKRRKLARANQGRRKGVKCQGWVSGAEASLMKILGADWSAFCKITSGVICWQGWRGSKQEQDPVFPGVISLVQANNLENNRECISLLHTFSRWKKTLTVQRVTVEVPKDQLDALKAAVKACKGKIL